MHMARGIDWLSSSHDKMHATVQRLVNYIIDTANRERMDFGATTKTGKWFSDELLPAVADYLPVYTAWLDPALRDPSKQDALEEAEKVLRPLMRTLYVYFLKNNYFVTDHDLSNMSLPKRTSGQAPPAPVATTPPWYKVVLALIATITIYYGATPGKKAKPKGQHGVECCYLISDTPVVDYALLVHSVFDTNSPLAIEFSGNDRGKTVYFALRWENSRGQKGPFGPIMSAIIP